MWRNMEVLLSALVVASVIGCGKSDGPGQGQAPSGQREDLRISTSIDPTTVAQTGTPAGAVKVFLQAVRAGNDEQAAAMLTTLARKKTAEMKMQIAPPGSDTAQFEVGDASPASEGAVHVASTWSDLDHNQQRQSDEIVWVVKQESQGWRISGVAKPLVLDFERPEEMIRKQGLAQEEVHRRAQQEKSQANRPENPQNSVR